MDTISELLLWLSVVFPLVFSAGPGNILCAVSGAKNGFKKSIPFVLGLNLVYTAYSLLAGFGMASVVARYPTVFHLFQILGALYIGWLGYRFFYAHQNKESRDVKGLTFMDGVISQALNIKGIAIVFTMYSQFIDTDNPLLFEVGTLSLALLLLNLFTHFTWVYGGEWMAQRFASVQAMQLQGRIFGAMLVVVAIWLLCQSLA